MNRAEYLMTVAAEEATEVGQRIAKALRFGLTEVQAGQALTNAERIIGEYRDLEAMLYWMAVEGLIPLDYEGNRDSRTAKRAKVEKFMAISREQGVLDQ